MRRLASLYLVVLTLGCKSPEEKACVNTVRLIAESGVTDGRSDDGKSESDRRDDCLDSLGRLRQQLQPDQEQWFAYLRCLTEAQSMKEQFDCLAPLTAAPAPASADAKQPSR